MKTTTYTVRPVTTTKYVVTRSHHETDGQGRESGGGGSETVGSFDKQSDAEAVAASLAAAEKQEAD